MNFPKLLSILCIVLIISINLINSTEYDYESDYEISDLALNNSLTLNESLAINGTEDDYYYDYEEDDEEECTVDTFIDHYTELLLPEDYEKGKQMDFTQKSYTFPESIARIKRLNQYQKNVTKKLDPILKRVIPRLSEMLFYIDLPSDCMASLVRIGQAARNGERWAMKFMNSMPPSKLSLQLNGIPFGEYDECLSIESPDTNDTEKPKIFGHFCSMGVPTNLLPPSNEDQIEDIIRIHTMNVKKIEEYLNGTDNNKVKIDSFREKLQGKYDGKLMFNIIQYMEYLGGDQLKLPPGLCLPSTCNPKDVEYAINKILFPMTRVNMIIHPDCDYLDKPIRLNIYQIISIVSIVLITLVCMICTTIWLFKDRFCPNSTTDGQPMSSLFKITDCFSIIPNLKAIFNTSQTNEKFSAMGGIRAILCFWMFMEHAYMSGLLVLHTKKFLQSATYKMTTELKYILLINVNLTDTFFLIGGFMTSYILLTKLEKSRGKFNYIQYVLYRYLRMLPVILAGIAITFVLELFGDGPIWPAINFILQKGCSDSFLPAILMYNNVMSFPNMITCLPFTWYTSADFQLYLLAPVIILVLYYWPMGGVIWNLLFIILGMLIATAPKLLWGIPHYFEVANIGINDLSLDLAAQLITRYHWSIEPHIQVYVIGILFGYLLRKHPNVYLGGRWGEVLIWLSTWALTFYAIFWHRNYFNISEYKITESEVINWIAFCRSCYSVGWSWTFYACGTGRGGFINKFFSWNGFKPFAYLMLEIYILHLYIIAYRIGTLREHVFYSDYYVWTTLVFDYILIFTSSIVVNVLVTKPFANLLELLIKKPNKKEILDDINTNDLKHNSNGKLDYDENNVSIVLKNVAFDGITINLTDKQLTSDTILQNLDNNNNNTNDINTDSIKDNELKM